MNTNKEWGYNNITKLAARMARNFEINIPEVEPKSIPMKVMVTMLNTGLMPVENYEECNTFLQQFCGKYVAGYKN